MDKFLETLLLRAIPEAVYDLIGRILPGGVVVAAITPARELVFSKDAVVFKNTGALELVAFFAFAYAAGLAISTFTHLIHIGAWRSGVFPWCLKRAGVVESLQRDLRSVRVGDHTDDTLDKKNPLKAEFLLDRAHDYIKGDGKRPIVVKLFAEVSLLYGLAIATSVVLLVTRDWSWDWLIPLAFLVAGYIRSVRVWFRHASILRDITARHHQTTTS